MILKYGSKSNSKQAVRAYLLLMGLPLGNTFTVKAKTATKNFQKKNGLIADGIAGPLTLSCLAKQLPDVKYLDYSKSKYVKAVQALVGSSIDGMYGKNTRMNVLAFKASAGLEPTDTVTTNDWHAMFDCEYTKAPASGTNTAQPVDYKQGDKRWGSIVYTAYNDKSQTIANSGCGPTAMADIMATWVDKNITPVEMCDYAIKHGFRTRNSGTAWAFFKSIAEEYGYSGFVQTKSMSTARTALKNGAFVVASMGPGYWTKGGHYICLWKTDETYMYANDPASSKRTKQKLGAFEEQRKQFFVFYKGESMIKEETPEEPKAIIDISKWQGKIDFAALKSEVSMVIARCSCGSDIDSKFNEYASEMNKHGIPFGVYCYSYAGDVAKAKDEAQKMVKYASDYNPLFYVMDAEESKITKESIVAFANELDSLGVQKIGCYVANHRYNQYGFGDVKDLFDFVWIPSYGKNDGTVEGSKKPSYPCDLWQYTSAGKIAGVNGNIDMNVITGTGKTLKWFLGKE